MRYITSGESHGKQLTVIIEGLPANLELSLTFINQELKRRQGGLGRGERMKIENDEAEIVSGVLFGNTTGAPLCLVIKNRDYEHHKDYMEPFASKEGYNEIKVPRPGHADLNGALKYSFYDMRPVFERASARETAARCAAGAVAKEMLAKLNIQVLSYVKNIGGIETNLDYNDYVEDSPVRMPDPLKSAEAVKLIAEVKAAKDTLGGIAVVQAVNVPAGVGSYVSSTEKLDAKIAAALMSIQSCKGVEFGAGFGLAGLRGSESHDEIIYEDGFGRTSNHYGGIEGGMTAGMPIVVKCVFKPVPTLMEPLHSVNIETKAPVLSHIERSDVCVVPSAGIVAENVLAFEIASALCAQFTSDTMAQLEASVREYRDYLKRF